jgi:hypothetical protein
MFLGAAGLVEEVLEFVDFGVKTVVQSKASLIAVVVLKVIAAKRKDQKFDRSSKSVLEFKASLIAAKLGKQRNFGGFVIRFIKNIQPISVGV